MHRSEPEGHFWPQAPQWSTWSRYVHMPSQQRLCSEQTLPQAPQWFGLAVTLTHLPLQQREPCAQFWPHAPQ